MKAQKGCLMMKVEGSWIQITNVDSIVSKEKQQCPPLLSFSRRDKEITKQTKKIVWKGRKDQLQELRLEFGRAYQNKKRQAKLVGRGKHDA